MNAEEVLHVWRNLNALAAFFALGGLIHAWVEGRKKMTPEGHVLVMGIALLLFAVCYGSLEQAYWPELWIRVPITTISLTWLLLGAGLTIRKHRQERRE